MSGRERRVHPRTRIALSGELVRNGKIIEGVIENIGRGGVFFATEMLEIGVDEGDDVTLCFEAPKDGATMPLELPSSVLRVERYFDGERVVRAFAVRFDGELELDEFDF